MSTTPTMSESVTSGDRVAPRPASACPSRPDRLVDLVPAQPVPAPATGNHRPRLVTTSAPPPPSSGAHATTRSSRSSLRRQFDRAASASEHRHNPPTALLAQCTCMLLQREQLARPCVRYSSLCVTGLIRCSLRLHLLEPAHHAGELQPGQGHGDVARIDLAGRPAAAPPPARRPARRPPGRCTPRGPARPTPRRTIALGETADVGDRRSHRDVHRVRIVVAARLSVEHRPGQHRRLQCELERLALDHRSGVAGRCRTRTLPRRGTGAGLPPAAATARFTGSMSMPRSPASLRAYSGPQRPVLDLRDQRRRLAQRGDPALGGIEVVAREHRTQRERDQRLAAGDQVAHRGVALGQPQLARVHVVRADRDERLGDEPLVVVERPQRRLLPGRVAVEREDDLAGQACRCPSAAGAARRCGRRRTPCRRSRRRSARRRGGRPSRRCSPRRSPPCPAARSPAWRGRCRRARAISCRATSPACSGISGRHRRRTACARRIR